MPGLPQVAERQADHVEALVSEEPHRAPHRCGIIAQCFLVPVDLHRDSFRSRSVAVLVMIPLLWSIIFAAAQSAILPGATPDLVAQVTNLFRSDIEGRRRLGHTNATTVDEAIDICELIGNSIEGVKPGQVAALHYSLSISDMGCAVASMNSVDGAVSSGAMAAALNGISSWQGIVFSFTGFNAVAASFGLQSFEASRCAGLPATGLGALIAITAEEQLCGPEVLDMELEPCIARVDAAFDGCLSFAPKRIVERARADGHLGIGDVLIGFLAAVQGLAAVIFFRSLAESFARMPWPCTCCWWAVSLREALNDRCGHGGTGYEGAEVPWICVTFMPSPRHSDARASGDTDRARLAAASLRTASLRFDGSAPYGTDKTAAHGKPHPGVAASSAASGGSPAVDPSSDGGYTVPLDLDPAAEDVRSPRSAASTTTTTLASSDARSHPDEPEHDRTFGRVLKYLERGGSPSVLIDPPTRIWLILTVVVVMCLFVLVTFSVIDASLEEGKVDSEIALCSIVAFAGTINAKAQAMGCEHTGIAVSSDIEELCKTVQPGTDPADRTNSFDFGSIAGAIVVYIQDLVQEDPSSCKSPVLERAVDLSISAGNFASRAADTIQAIRTGITVGVVLGIIVAVFASLRLVLQWRHVMAWVLTSGRDRWSHRAAVWSGGGRGNPDAISRQGASEVLGVGLLGIAERAGSAALAVGRRLVQLVSEGLVADDTSPIKQLPPTQLGYLSDVPLERFDITLAGDLLGVASWSILAASMLLGLIGGAVVTVVLAPGGINYIILPLISTYVLFFALTEITRCMMRRFCIEPRPGNGCCGANKDGYGGRVTAWRCFSWCDFSLVLLAQGRGPGFGFGRLYMMMLGQVSNLLAMERPIHSNSGLDRAFLSWGATIRGRIEAVIAAEFPDMGATQQTKGCMC